MRRFMLGLCLVGCLFGFLGTVAIANDVFDTLMSAEIQEQTGVADLTSQQRATLAQWVSTTIGRAYEIGFGKGKGETQAIASPNTSSVYRSVGGGHWVSRNNDSGRVIILEDGSIWQVDAINSIDSMLWLPTEDIVVKEYAPPLYRLINTETGDEVIAKFVGHE